MNTKAIATLKPITVFSFEQLNRTGVTQVLRSAEFRLLRYSHNTQTRCLELSCFRQGQYVKASLPEIHFDALKPYVGQTVRLDFHPTSCGFEPVLSVRTLNPVQNPQDPLATYMPLWLQSPQQALFGEFCRLVSQLDAPYRELVQQVFADERTLEAFLDRPASLGHHHKERGGLLAHTVDVVLDCEQACARYPGVNTSLTITSALLHDIGKCQEYVPRARGGFGRSQMGELEMHKTQGVRIVTLAAHQCQANELMVSEICHLLVASNGQEYMGLPRLKMAEASILQAADGRSSAVELYQSGHASTMNWQRFGGSFRSTELSIGAQS